MKGFYIQAKELKILDGWIKSKSLKVEPMDEVTFLKVIKKDKGIQEKKIKEPLQGYCINNSYWMPKARFEKNFQKMTDKQTDFFGLK